MQSRVPLGPGKFHVVVLVFYLKDLVSVLSCCVICITREKQWKKVVILCAYSDHCFQ